VTSPTPLLLAAVATSRITGIDWVVMALCFRILLCVAWWAASVESESASEEV